MNVASIIGRPLMDLATATTIGRVDDVHLDAVERRVVGLRIGKSKGPGTWLAFERITAVGVDAVTVADEQQVTDVPEGPLAGVGAAKLIGGRVLTEQGRDVGPLDDVEIDDDGSIGSLTVAGSAVDAGALIGIGSYAVVLRDPTPGG